MQKELLPSDIYILLVPTLITVHPLAVHFLLSCNIKHLPVIVVVIDRPVDRMASTYIVLTPKI